MADPPHVDILVDPTNLKQSFGQVLKQIRPEWDLEKLKFHESPLASNRGLLNTMVKCSYGNNPLDTIMVRVSNSEGDAFFGKRSNELKGIKHLYPKGCAPKVLASYKNGFCYEFIPGEVLDCHGLRKDPIWRRIAEEFAKFHTGDYEDEMMNKGIFPWLNMTAGSIVSLKDEDIHPKLKEFVTPMENFRKELDSLLEYVKGIGSPIVLCHNDVRGENMVWNSAKGQVHFVDFEGIGYGYQAMEIAHHFTRYAGINNTDHSLYPDEAFQRQWIHTYLTKLYQLTGKKEEVSEKHVYQLLAQVAKFRLVLLLTDTALAIKFSGLIDEIAPGQFDTIQFGRNSMKEYKSVKDEILALKIPEV